MRKLLLAVTTLAILLLSGIPAFAQEQSPSGFRVFWRDGMRMETEDGRFQLRLGGRIQYDWTFWGNDADVAGAVGGAIQDGTEFRRARVFVQGHVYEHIEYKFQMDFAGGDVAFKDVYFGIRDPHYGFRMGHFKEPFSLETLTSSKYITFVERALPGVFDAERNSGFMLHGMLPGDRIDYGIGVFRETDEGGVGNEPARYNVTGRVAGALRNEDEGRQVLHVGGSFTFQNGDGSPRQLTQRPEVHLAPRFVSSGIVNTDAAAVFGLEGAWVSGPLSAQAEVQVAPFSSEVNGDPTFWGAYLFGSYFLTGESRPYDGDVFDRLHPSRDFLDGSGGMGAWEIALRYSMLDLSSAGADRAGSTIAGAKLNDVTLGLNWYWNPMTLMRFNLVRADIVDVGAIWALVWRGQLEF